MILRNIYGKASGGKDNTLDFEKIYRAVLAGDSAGVIEALEINEAQALPVIIKAIKASEV